MVQIRLLVSLTYSLQSDLDLFLDLGHQLVLFQWQAGELEIHGRGIFHTGNNSHQLGIVEITTERREIARNGGGVLRKSPFLNDKAQTPVRRVNTSEENREGGFPGVVGAFDGVGIGAQSIKNYHLVGVHSR